MDKRSDLMKRGRVKRVYYEQTDAIQTNDARTAFADLEELCTTRPPRGTQSSIAF